MKQPLKLYPFQNACVEFALKAEYSINGCQMGLGKSVMALEVARRTRLKCLVIGPAFLRGTWVNEAKKHGSDITFISYSMIHKYKAKDLCGYGVWIADECTHLKNPRAKRTHAYYALLKDVRPPYHLALSATLVLNKILDLWVPLAICSQSPNETNGLRLTGDLQKFRAFSHYFCNVEILKIRGARVEKFSGVKAARVPEIKALLKDKFIQFKVEDVMKELPEMTSVEVMLDLKPVPGLEEAFDNYINGSKVDPTAKSLSALLKSPYTAEYVNLLLDQGESVLVFTDHVASAKEIRSRLKDYVVPCITGATASEQRHLYVEGFQAGTYKCIVATIGALSTGVTLTAAKHVVFCDLSWTHSLNQQAAARICRIGQKFPTFAHYMLGSPTDAAIMKVLVVKEQTIQEVLG